MRRKGLDRERSESELLEMFPDLDLDRVSGFTKRVMARVMADVWTLRELEEASGVSRSYLTRLCRDGRLDGYQLGERGQWLVFDWSVQRWLASDRKRGPKPKGQERVTGEQLRLAVDGVK